MTKVRFQADADLRQAIATGIIRKQPDIDFQSANEAINTLILIWEVSTAEEWINQIMSVPF
jgi:hypothetical protein